MKHILIAISILCLCSCSQYSCVEMYDLVTEIHTSVDGREDMLITEHGYAYRCYSGVHSLGEYVMINSCKN